MGLVIQRVSGQSFWDYLHKKIFSPLEMDDTDVVAVIQALTNADFDKSMTSYYDHKVWQDVYRPRVDDRTIYLKFTVDAQQAYLLISFKEE